jgi:hypothetical protein
MIFDLFASAQLVPLNMAIMHKSKMSFIVLLMLIIGIRINIKQ